MIKANSFVLITLFASLVFSSCESFESRNLNASVQVTGEVIANPITYEVLINNPNIEDEWRTECLENTNVKVMSEDIINAVMSGKLKAYDYFDKNLLSTDEVKVILKQNGQKGKIGNIQFIEEWYWNKKELQLQKKVKSLMFGYEIYDENNKVRGYRASFVVNLDEN